MLLCYVLNRGQYHSLVRPAILTRLTLEFAGRAPTTVTIIGVVPDRVSLGLELSPAVRRAIPGALAAITTALERHGLSVRPARCRFPDTSHATR